MNSCKTDLGECAKPHRKKVSIEETVSGTRIYSLGTDTKGNERYFISTPEIPSTPNQKTLGDYSSEPDVESLLSSLDGKETPETEAYWESAQKDVDDLACIPELEPYVEPKRKTIDALFEESKKPESLPQKAEESKEIKLVIDNKSYVLEGKNYEPAEKSPSPYTNPETMIEIPGEHPYIDARKKEIALEKAFPHNQDSLEKFVEIIRIDTLYIPKPKIKAPIWEVRGHNGRKKLVEVEHKIYNQIPLGPILEDRAVYPRQGIVPAPYTPSRLEKMESYVSKKIVDKMPEKAQEKIRSAYQAVKKKVKKIPLLGKLFR